MPAADHLPALEMLGVTVPALRDPDTAVLEDVRWTVASGEYWAVGGLHRTGKSDLMAVAGGVMRPASGTLRIFGQELMTGFESERLASRRPVGLVFDGGQLVHRLSLLENITLPLLYHLPPGAPEPVTCLEALVEFTGLAPLMGKLPAAVSRNQRQRIGLARALALRPRLLLLDNPLTGLDPRDAQWWLDALDALAAGHALLDHQPLTLVVTADDFRPWMDRARQFAVLKDRRFLPLGNRAEARANADPLLEDLLHRSLPLGSTE